MKRPEGLDFTTQVTVRSDRLCFLTVFERGVDPKEDTQPHHVYNCSRQEEISKTNTRSKVKIHKSSIFEKLSLSPPSHYSKSTQAVSQPNNNLRTNPSNRSTRHKAQGSSINKGDQSRVEHIPDHISQTHISIITVLYLRSSHSPQQQHGSLQHLDQNSTPNLANSFKRQVLYIVPWLETSNSGERQT